MPSRNCPDLLRSYLFLFPRTKTFWRSSGSLRKRCERPSCVPVSSPVPFRPQGLRTRISRLGALGKLGLPLLYSQAGQQSNAFCSIDRQDYTTSSGTSAP